MKKWIPISAVVLLSACDHPQNKIAVTAIDSFMTTGFSKITTGDNFTVTLSRGSGFSVYEKVDEAEAAYPDFTPCKKNRQFIY